jgi:asparagine synthase (glutamine-hydrolysing)
MCGFTGFFGEGDYEREKVIDEMSAAIAHRGPDSDGKFVEGDIALGFRRLSIIDLDGGHQPIYSPDGRYVIVFNGEIYNYRELRAELKEKYGHTFNTDSDTEVILHTYMQYGTDAASYLRGMFAFVIYDREKKSVYGARDMFGIKPFYWSRSTKRISSVPK